MNATESPNRVADRTNIWYSLKVASTANLEYGRWLQTKKHCGSLEKLQ